MKKKRRLGAKRATNGAAVAHQNGSGAPRLVAISEADVKTLAEINARITRLKVALADCELQHDQSRKEIVAAIAAAHSEVQTAAKSVAQSHGVDPNAKMNIDLDKMTLTYL